MWIGHNNCFSRFSCSRTSFWRCSTFKFDHCSFWFFTVKSYIKIRFNWRNFCIFRFPYSGRQWLSNNLIVLCYFFIINLTKCYFRIYCHRNLYFCRSITLRTHCYGFMRSFYSRCCWLAILPSNTWICYPCRNFHKIACSAYIRNSTIFNHIDRFRLNSN